MVEVNKEEARQGETRNEVRWILLISTALAVVVLFAFLFFNMGEDEAVEAEASAPAPTEQVITETSIYLV